ncbi:hypothetical protein RPHASCH2410_CH11275 [Rhizobium phaseoli Ch24-10]|nr:hypothetical protein RPHASCH2410_CH11275 [Rhizobium phaseoli Ch24-10]
MLTSARKWRGRHTAARRRCRFSPGPSASAVVVAFRHRFLRSCSRFPLAAHFFLAFFRLALVRPALRRFSGRETVAAIRAKARRT